MSDLLKNIKLAGAIPVECCGTCEHVRPGWDLCYCNVFKSVTAEFMRCKRYKKHAQFASEEIYNDHS